MQERRSRICLQQDEILKTEQITPPLEAPGSFPDKLTTIKKSDKSNAGKSSKRYGWSADAISANVTTSTCKTENGVDKEHWSHATEMI
jgi:hypothetical protein